MRNPRWLVARRARLVHVVSVAVFVLLALLSVPQAASAHVERPSYWPDPKADCAVKPCAGGKVPKARSLRSALDNARRGRTRVVCKPNSLHRLRASVRHARKDGFYIRPTDHRSLSAKRAHALLRINKRLFRRCDFHSIQRAVNASHNNDRVVVMPGLYRERHSRRQPTHDAACKQYAIKSDSGDPGALSHDYQIHCPNDANLVAVIGRGPDTAPPPSPPLTDRHGIPNVGPCIRCNLQLEGSGVSADDVVVEAGSAKAGDGGPSAAGHKKDVGIFVDRADGFVLRNLTVRHAREHDIYILETDGYLFDRFKTFYAGGYGVLTFVEDHGVIQNCEAAGNGDSGLYPGSGADSTDHRYQKFYPEYRYSQVLRYCDSHHNTGGFSGTDSHGTLITHNNFYDNALGYTTDVFTAPGHPGFPQHGNVVVDNNFYSNNFNPYLPGSDVAPFIPAPVGTGLWLAGGNANEVNGNHFYDNWRRGMMLFAAPDATVCGPDEKTPIPGCDPTKISTSYDNHVHDNVMGVDPSTGAARPNGLDFWWDSFPGNTGNCWWGNTAAPGKSVTSSPALLPDCANGTNPGSSIGLGDVANELELVACLAGLQVAGYPNGSSTTCSWPLTPGRPGSGTGRIVAGRATTDRQAAELGGICAVGLAPRLCSAYSALATLHAQDDEAAASKPGTSRSRVTPVPTAGPLSLFTCSWWRKADAAHRLGMVQRITHFATMPIDGPTPYGHGAGLSDERATKLFNSRCSTAYAGPFALYKLYGAAAPFSALVR
jgi:hypothetical protein